MVIAVLQRWGGVALGGKDVLAATVGPREDARVEGNAVWLLL